MVSCPFCKSGLIAENTSSQYDGKSLEVVIRCFVCRKEWFGSLTPNDYYGDRESMPKRGTKYL